MKSQHALRSAGLAALETLSFSLVPRRNRANERNSFCCCSSSPPSSSKRRNLALEFRPCTDVAYVIRVLGPMRISRAPLGPPFATSLSPPFAIWQRERSRGRFGGHFFLVEHAEIEPTAGQRFRPNSCCSAVFVYFVCLLSFCSVLLLSWCCCPSAERPRGVIFPWRWSLPEIWKCEVCRFRSRLGKAVFLVLRFWEVGHFLFGFFRRCQMHLCYFFAHTRFVTNSASDRCTYRTLCTPYTVFCFIRYNTKLNILI